MTSALYPSNRRMLERVRALDIQTMTIEEFEYLREASSTGEFDLILKDSLDILCPFCNTTVSRAEIDSHFQTREHKDNVTKGLLLRPVGDLCDGCEWLLLTDYDAFCKVDFVFMNEDSKQVSIIFNLFCYCKDAIGPLVDWANEKDYKDWDIKAVKPESCKKYHPALHKKSIPSADETNLETIKDVMAARQSNSLLNSNTLTFTRGKYENIPIWNVAVLDPKYLVRLCQESETDEDTITMIEEYIDKNIEQFDSIDI